MKSVAQRWWVVVQVQEHLVRAVAGSVREESP
jgi:hypothetical protein